MHAAQTLVPADPARPAPEAATAPPVEGVDHIHLQVADRAAAVAWYRRVLGLQPVPELAVWATADGPLTVGDASSRVHLALFQGVASGPRVTVALGASAAQMPRWQAHLARSLGRAPDWVDHGLSASMYLADPDGNRFEITCSDPVAVEAWRALQRLLDAQLALPAEYGDQLTSHLPMALQALHRLGADAATLQAFDTHYRERFAPGAAQPVPDPQAWPDWPQHLGDPAALPRLHAHFRWALAEQGEDAVLAGALPRLWPGLAAAALHGPIRLAHALAAGHAGETALALAYWAARWQVVPGPAQPSAEPRLPWGAWLHALHAARVHWPATPSLIARRMADAAAACPAFGRLALGPAPDTGGPATLAAALDALAPWAAARYAEAGDFTVLHLVTGVGAMRALVARTSPGPALETLWPVVVAAWLATRRPPVPPLPEPVPDGATLQAAALRSADDHVIKLVVACADGAEAGLGEAAVWRAAAWRAVSRDNRRP